MGRTLSERMHRRIRRDRLLRRVRRSRARLPGPPTCVRCGYDLRDLPELVCPECNTRIDPAWYRAPLAAGSKARRALVTVGVMNAGMLALALLAGVLILTAIPARLGVGQGAPWAIIAILSVGFGMTLGVGGFAWSRRRRLIWGPRRGVTLVHAIVLVIFVLLLITGELATRPLD